ncbi:uncharacterized protein [Henckelia pumila]|uniref:uncharacterized protein n=1 Tax=Henckelia pumila TaxID=405737 RepID=UPI003C6E1FCB
MNERRTHKVKYKDTTKFQYLPISLLKKPWDISDGFLDHSMISPIEACLMEERDGIPNGWPLGLGNIMNSTIRVAHTARPPPPPRDPPPPYASAVQYRSSSFSSLSTTSNLDTESTASFFPDQSVSLGWLFGIRDKGGDERRRCVTVIDMSNVRGSDLGTHDGHENSRGLCVPLLLLVGRLSRRGSISGN